MMVMLASGLQNFALVAETVPGGTITNAVYMDRLIVLKKSIRGRLSVAMI